MKTGSVFYVQYLYDIDWITIYECSTYNEASDKAIKYAHEYNRVVRIIEVLTRVINEWNFTGHKR